VNTIITAKIRNYNYKRALKYRLLPSAFLPQEKKTAFFTYIFISLSGMGTYNGEKTDIPFIINCFYHYGSFFTGNLFFYIFSTFFLHQYLKSHSIFLFSGFFRQSSPQIYPQKVRNACRNEKIIDFLLTLPI